MLDRTEGSLASVWSNWRPTVYISIAAEELLVRHVQTRRFIAQRPVAALAAADGTWLAVGKAAEKLNFERDVKLVNPFDHPRLVIADFDAARYVLCSLLQRLFAIPIKLTLPLMIVHPRLEPTGGFLELELRALHELALAAGAWRTLLWSGSQPSDLDMLNQDFQCSGRVLQI